MKTLLLAFFLAITFFLVPVTTFAANSDISPELLDVSKNFSEKFCTSIENGVTPEKAAESAANQLAKGLLFSPFMDEIMSTPKDAMAASLSTNILDGCGDDIGVAKEDLDVYLARLAQKVPSRSPRSFTIIR